MREWLRRIGESTHLSEKSIVLDIGCGTGRFAIPIAEEFGCRVIGIDKNPDRLRRAREKPSKSKSKIEWMVGDIHDLNQILADYEGRIDCVWISSVLEELNLFDRGTLIGQSSQLLRERGKLLIRTTTPPLIEQVGLFRFFDRGWTWMKLHAPQMSEVWAQLHDHFLIPSKTEFINDFDQIPLDDFVSKLRDRVYPWTTAYNDADLEVCIQLLLEDAQLQGVRSCFDRRPAYFVCAEKPGEIQDFRPFVP
jgi:ubiquinone/menaquinone biosynthesis C-methylase UbiE